MKKLALLGAGLLALAAGPALAQAGGASPAPGGSVGGGGAADRLEMPTREGANAQQAMDQQGELGTGFVQGGRASKRAEAYRNKLQAFADQSANRRYHAMSTREDALAGKPIPYSSRQIRDELLQDMEDWRKEFRIPRREFEGLRDEIVVAEGSLTPAQWADRRAQWFELRDQWIAEQMASAGG